MATKAPTKTKAGKAAVPAPAVPGSLVLRWWTTFRFAERGWSAHRTFTDACVDALAATASWDHLDLLSVDGAAGKPRPPVAAIKKAFATAKARFAILTGGQTIHKGETSAFIEVEVSPRVVRILAAARGEPLAVLGPKALDDFFTVARTLHDAFEQKAHVTDATAWTDWEGNSAEARMVSAHPLRRIAEIIDPKRPPLAEDDANLVAVQAIASAKPPTGVTRTTHGSLVELRWVDDPRDAAAANAAALRHEAWMKPLVEHEPLSD